MQKDFQSIQQQSLLY